MRSVEIVAEIAASHNGSLDRALRLIEAAKRAGADAVKLQTYRPGSLTIDHDGPGFVMQRGPWAGRKLFDLYREAATPYEWHAALFDHARAVGIVCFSTPFDHHAVALLESLGCPRYKIASFEIVDLALIRSVAATGRPLIVSTGMASDSEIADALGAADGDVTLLHCVSAYPAKPEQANLKRIVALRERFCVPVGISDHTLGIAIPVAAVALGAVMIEKHLTLARADGGPDAAFSLEPAEFKAMVDAVREVEKGLSTPTQSNEMNELRRSLYAVSNILAGETITERNVRAIRPGHGLAPKHLPGLLGRKVKTMVPRGTPMSFELVA